MPWAPRTPRTAWRTSCGTSSAASSPTRPRRWPCSTRPSTPTGASCPTRWRPRRPTGVGTTARRSSGSRRSVARRLASRSGWVTAAPTRTWRPRPSWPPAPTGCVSGPSRPNRSAATPTAPNRARRPGCPTASRTRSTRSTATPSCGRRSARRSWTCSWP